MIVKLASHLAMVHRFNLESTTARPELPIQGPPMYLHPSLKRFYLFYTRLAELDRHLR